MPSTVIDIYDPVRGPQDITLRPTFVALCDHSVCAALMLDLFCSGIDHEVADEAAWLAARLDEMTKGLSNAYGRDAIRRAFALLEDRNLIVVRDVSRAVHNTGRVLRPDWDEIKRQSEALGDLPTLPEKQAAAVNEIRHRLGRT